LNYDVLNFEVQRSDTKNWLGGPTKGKNGVGYSNYALMPTTLAAEILSLNGIQLKEYQPSSSGHFKKAYTKVAGWCLNPETFPFYKSNKGKIKGTSRQSYKFV
jgi:hypothetical protein